MSNTTMNRSRENVVPSVGRSTVEFRTAKDSMLGMTPAQLIEERLLERLKASDGPEVARVWADWLVGDKDRRDWVDRYLPTAQQADEQRAEGFLRNVVKKTLVDAATRVYTTVDGMRQPLIHPEILTVREIVSPTLLSEHEYYGLVHQTEESWRKFSQKGTRDLVMEVRSTRSIGGPVSTRVTGSPEPADGSAVWGAIDNFLDVVAKSPWAKTTAAAGVVAAVTASCAAPSPPAIIAEAPTDVVVTQEVGRPTLVSTQTEAVKATPTVPPVRENSGGMYTEAQWVLVSEGAFAGQERTLTRWVVEYWGSMLLPENERMFYPVVPGDFSNLHFKYLFDEHDPTQAIVVLETSDTPGVVWSLPILTESDEFGFRTTPPELEAGGHIETGQGPLKLSVAGVFESGGDHDWGQFTGKQWRLANVDGELVRMVGDEVVAVIDHAGEGGWIPSDVVAGGEPTEAVLPTAPSPEPSVEPTVLAPVPTENPYRGGTSKPGTEAEALAKCPVAPNPITDTQAFLDWKKGFEESISKVLKPFVLLTGSTGGGTSDDYEIEMPSGVSYGCLQFDGNIMVVLRWSEGSGHDPFEYLLLDKNYLPQTPDQILRILKGGGRVGAYVTVNPEKLYEGSTVQVSDSTFLRQLMAAVPGIHQVIVEDLDE